MKRYDASTTVGLMVGLLAFASLARADSTIEDFESYTNGQIVGLTATSSPWRRFGMATNDNITATGQKRWVISGDRSGLYGLVWPNSFGAIRYVFSDATDLSSHGGATVKMRSNRADTHTVVKLAVSNGATTFVTAADRPLTTQVQQLTFEISPSKMIRTAGPDGYEEVIHGAWSIGFDFLSSDDPYTETIVFDDFVIVGQPGDNATSGLQASSQ